MTLGGGGGGGGNFPPTTIASDDGSWGGAGMTDATALLGDSVPPVVLAVGGTVLAGELNTGSGMILGAIPPNWKPYVARVSAQHTAGYGVIGPLCGACRSRLGGRRPPGGRLVPFPQPLADPVI